MAIDLIDMAAPKNNGAFPIIDTNHALGGRMSVADITARNAIPAGRRRAGMQCFVQSNSLTYLLAGDLTTWLVDFGADAMRDAEEGLVTVSVAAAGSDAPTEARPARLKSGTYADAFQTIEAAVAALYKGTKRAVINLAAEEFKGFSVKGFTGDFIEIVGAWATPTLTTGVTSGTCGAGSGATIVNKPTAAANWTVNELRGKYFRPTAGAAYFGADHRYEAAYLILSNTTTQLVLAESAFGVDATTPFQLSECGTTINEVATDNIPAAQNAPTYMAGAFNSTAGVNLFRMVLDSTDVPGSYGFTSAQTQNTDLTRCKLLNTFALPGYSSNLRLVSCFLESSYYYAYGQNVTSILASAGLSSTIQFEHFQVLTLSGIYMDGDIGFAPAISISHGVSCTIGGEVKNAASAAPIALKNIHNFGIGGTLSGANPSTTYGMTIEGGGQFNISGASVAGASGNQMLIETIATPYSSALGNEAIQMKGTVVTGGTGYHVFPSNGIVISGTGQIYGFFRPLGGAYKDTLAAQSNGGTPAYPSNNAQSVAYSSSFIRTAAADGDSIRGFDSVAHPGEPLVTGGLSGVVKNMTAFVVYFYPPTGQSIFLGDTQLAVNTPCEIGPGMTMTWLTDNDKNWHISF